MSVYVVRLRQDRDEQPSLVGIYVAGSIEALEEKVGHACLSCVCEYALVPHGCLYAPPEGERLYDEAQEHCLLPFDTLSEDWHELFGTAALDWQVFREPGWRTDRERQLALAAARQVLKAA